MSKKITGCTHNKNIFEGNITKWTNFSSVPHALKLLYKKPTFSGARPCHFANRKHTARPDGKITKKLNTDIIKVRLRY